MASAACEADENCETGACAGDFSPNCDGTCGPKGDVGDVGDLCDAGSDCLSNGCKDRKCYEGAIGDGCLRDRAGSAKA